MNEPRLWIDVAVRTKDGLLYAGNVSKLGDEKGAYCYGKGFVKMSEIEKWVELPKDL